MKRETVYSALLGALFGGIGLLIANAMMGIGSFNRLNMEVVSVIIIFLGFSALFGARVRSRIHRGKSPIWSGIVSSFLTTYCTIITLSALYSFQGDPTNLQEMGGAVLVLLIYTTIIGGIPMLLLGALFGGIIAESNLSQDNPKRGKV